MQQLLRKYIRESLSLVETYQSHTFEPEVGDAVRNVNPNCKHFQSQGTVLQIQDLPRDSGKLIKYRVTNDGDSFQRGDILHKTMDQLAPMSSVDDDLLVSVYESMLAEKKKKKGLWDNIRAKRARGAKPAKPGEKGYPSEKSWKAAQEADIPESVELSESARYHLKKQVGFERNIHRPGSTAFFALFREARRLYRAGYYQPKSAYEFELLRDSDIGEFAFYEGRLVPLDYPILAGQEGHLNEAEYKGKKVDLNVPKKGEGGKSYVYVNAGKTKDGKVRVKKVTFGSSMPDAMGDSEAARKRRKSFGDRHGCAKKNDKTKAGYWACRATKFFGRNISGWW